MSSNLLKQGLKGYTKQFSFNFDNLVDVHINLSKKAHDIILTWPLISTSGHTPFSASLIYSHQNRNTSSFFGNGINLNYFKNLTPYTSHIVVNNPDGTTDTYEQSKNYKNDETNCKINVVKTNEYTVDRYEIVDDEENKIVYNPSFLSYPSQIIVNNETYTLDFVPVIKSVRNAYGDVLNFYKSGERINKINYFDGSKEIEFVEVIYYEEENAIQYKWHFEENIVKNFLFTFSSNKIEIHNVIAGHLLTINLNSNQEVTSIIDNKNIIKNTYFAFENNKTTVTDYKNDKCYYFFDSDGYLLYEMDNLGTAVESEIDKEKKRILSISNPIQVINRAINLFPDNVSTFSLTNITLEPISITDPIFAPILSNSVYQLSPVDTNLISLATYELDIDGIGGEEIVAVIWAKQLVPYSSQSKVEVLLELSSSHSASMLIDKDHFKKSALDDTFELMTLGVYSDVSFNKITLRISMSKNTPIQIGGIQVLRKKYGATLSYDENNKISSLENSGNTSSFAYSNGNKNKTMISALSSTRYAKDDQNRLSISQDGNYLTTSYEYDEDYPLNVNKIYTFLIGDDDYFLTTKNYDSQGRHLVKETTNINNSTYFAYDSFHRVSTVTDAVSATISFAYNDNNFVSYFSIDQDHNESFLNYLYNTQQILYSLYIENHDTTVFRYDAHQNITKLLLATCDIYTYAYNSNDSLTSISYGLNNDSYLFSYNNFDAVDTISYQKNNITNLRFTYNYDNRRRLNSIFNENNLAIEEIAYDDEDRVVSYSQIDSTINYYYSIDGLTVNKKFLFDDASLFYQTIEPSSIFKKITAESILEYYKTRFDLFVADFMESTDFCGKDKTISAIHTLPPYKGSYDKFIPHSSLMGDPQYFKYIIDLNPTNPLEGGCIAFWFMPYSSDDVWSLFKAKSSDNQSEILVYHCQNYIYLKITDFNGNVTNALSLYYPLVIGKFYFFALNFANRNDGQGYSDDCFYTLKINEVTKTFSQSNPRVNCELGSNPTYIFLTDETDSEKRRYLSCAFFSKRCYLEQEYVEQFYQATKRYVIDKDYFDENDKSIVLGSSAYYDSSNLSIPNTKFYPLSNNVISINGDRPSLYNLRKILGNDETFVIDYASNSYSLYCDGNLIAYPLSPSSGNHIVLEFKINNPIPISRYILDCRDGNNNHISVFINSDNYLVVCINNEEIVTNLYVNSGVFHQLSISSSISIGSVTETTFKIKLDDSDYYFTLPMTMIFGSDANIYLGRKKNPNTIYSLVGKLEDSLPLHGYIRNLFISPTELDNTALSNIKEFIKPISHKTLIDAYGLVKSQKTNYKNVSLITKQYTYKKDDHQLSSNLSKEVIKLGDVTLTTRKYETDKLGRVTKITDSLFGTHTYEYNHRGFLVRDNDVTFTYDENGNILSKGNSTYEYNSGVKDVLVRYNSYLLTSDTNNIFLPTAYRGFTYEYEGKRLVKVTSPYNVVTQYKYNDKGYRIEKNHNGTITKYYYEGDKLIKEVSPNKTIDFLYDENNCLFGFLLNGSNYYFYVRDALQTILGIVDSNGNVVTKYSYSPYGECSISSDTSTHIASLSNPIKYKGYYFDEETQLFYCNSRYYSPELCRFISPDSIEYLDPQSINGLNLYCYCMNNPIMYADPSGHSIIAVLAIAALIGAGVNAGISIGRELLIGNFNPLDWDWKNIVGSALVGAALGIATAAGGLAGIGAVSGWATVGLFAGTTALSFGAGAAQYALNYVGTDEFSWSELFIDAGLTAVQSMISFGLGAAMSSSGMWKSLNKGEFLKSYSSLRTQGNNFAKSFFKTTGIFLKNNGAQIIERSFVRNVFTIPYAILKYFI